MRDGLCAAKSFGRLAPVVFKARAFAIRDPEIAFARFKTFAEEVGKLGKKTVALERKRRAGTCDNSIAGKMPCHLLDFATTEKACQLAQRAEALFGFVKERCDAEWSRFFGNVSYCRFFFKLLKLARQMHQLSDFLSKMRISNVF